MKIATLFSTPAQISYKHSICSCAAFFVFVSTIFAIITPIYIIVYINNDLWYQPKTVYEQPITSFQYKYILMGVHGSSIDNNIEISDVADASNSVLAVISSFRYFNEVTEPWQRRSTVKVKKIKFWKEDFDHNKMPDRMHFQFTYEPIADMPLKNLHIFLELDAFIEKHHCRLHIPSAVILSNEQLPPNFQFGQMTIEGKLILEQKSSFYCPHFMRNVKSNFYHELIPINSTNIKDYELATIKHKLANNVGYIRFDQTNTRWDRHFDNKLIINVCVDIGEIMTRFHTTFWQKMILFWTEYLALLVIFSFVITKMKFYVFSRQLLRAWEIIPWKKIY